jgi:hypothetical protein
MVKSGRDTAYVPFRLNLGGPLPREPRPPSPERALEAGPTKIHLWNERAYSRGCVQTQARARARAQLFSNSPRGDSGNPAEAPDHQDIESYRPDQQMMKPEFGRGRKPILALAPRRRAFARLRGRRARRRKARSTEDVATPSTIPRRNRPRAPLGAKVSRSVHFPVNRRAHAAAPGQGAFDRP